MREMKNSGIEWIGDIPLGWEVRKVKNYYDMQTGFTPDTKNELYYDDCNGFDWVNISDIQDGKPIFNTKKKVSKYFLDLFNPDIIPEGSLLYSFKLSVGQTAYAGKPIYSNEAIASFLPSEHVNLHYLRYSSMFIVENAQINIYNAKILNQDLIRNAYITFPPLPEQQKIADYLDCKCAEIDAVIEKTKSTIEEYKKLKQSVITEAITKGIRGNRPMKDSGIEWIGEIPADWVIGKIKYGVSKVGSGKTPLGGVESYADEGILFLRSQNVYDTGLSLEAPTYITTEVDEEMKNTRVYPHDVLLNITGGSIGRCCIFPEEYVQANVNQHVSIIRVIDTIFTPEYMHYYWLSALGHTAIDLYQTGGNREGMSADAIKNSPIPIITVEEQKEIVKYLDKKCAEIDTLIAKKTTLLEEMENYKKSVIYEYVTGKKEVM